MSIAHKQKHKKVWQGQYIEIIKSPNDIKKKKKKTGKPRGKMNQHEPNHLFRQNNLDRCPRAKRQIEG